jgi:hypothetical protein
MSDEAEGKGCFWALAGIALCIFALFAGLALLGSVQP